MRGALPNDLHRLQRQFEPIGRKIRIHLEDCAAGGEAGPSSSRTFQRMTPGERGDRKYTIGLNGLMELK